MSKWVQITGSIYIWTRSPTENAGAYINRHIVNAPKITGSEGNAIVFVNPLSSQADESSAFERRRAVISVVGELRDRTPAVTKREWRNFLKFVRTLGVILNSSCEIRKDNWR